MTSVAVLMFVLSFVLFVFFGNLLLPPLGAVAHCHPGCVAHRNQAIRAAKKTQSSAARMAYLVDFIAQDARTVHKEGEPAIGGGFRKHR